MLKNRAIIYLLCTIFLSVPAWESNAQEADEYVLESIEVPKGNPIRTETNVPRLYIEIEKNGTLEGTSEASKGWHVNFKDIKRNRLVIDQNKDDKYTIKIWTYNWFFYGDQLLLSIGDLDYKAFQNEILEKGDTSVPTPSGRLVRIKFKKVG